MGDRALLWLSEPKFKLDISTKKRWKNEWNEWKMNEMNAKIMKWWKNHEMMKKSWNEWKCSCNEEWVTYVLNNL